VRYKLLKFGVAGLSVTLVLWFTPVLSIVLTRIGMSSILAAMYKDAILFMALAAFLLPTLYALCRLRSVKSSRIRKKFPDTRPRESGLDYDRITQ